MKNKDLKKRIIEISYNHKLSHLGSVLTAVDIIDEIFRRKKPEERFLLSCGHAGLAYYVVLEKYGGKKAEAIYEHHGTHPDRCKNCRIDCSTGSLGHGIAIAVGMALAGRNKNVYCLISDGECGEGSVTEALRVAVEQKLTNLFIYVNINGYSAYRRVATLTFPKGSKRLNLFLVHTNYKEYPFLKGLNAHYCTLSKEDYEKAIRRYSL